VDPEQPHHPPRNHNAPTPPNPPPHSPLRALTPPPFRLTGCLPDCAMIVVGANMGVARMTREHIGVALALTLPVFFVVTKIDIAPPHILAETLEHISKVGGGGL
jgi:hypothetical protein